MGTPGSLTGTPNSTDYQFPRTHPGPAPGILFLDLIGGGRADLHPLGEAHAVEREPQGRFFQGRFVLEDDRTMQPALVPRELEPYRAVRAQHLRLGGRKTVVGAEQEDREAGDPDKESASLLHEDALNKTL